MSPRRAGSVSSTPLARTHGMQTRSRSTKSPSGVREARAPPSIATPSSGRYGAPVGSRVGGTDVGSGRAFAQAFGEELDHDKEIPQRQILDSLEEVSEANLSIIEQQSQRSFESESVVKEDYEGGISDVGSSKQDRSSKSATSSKQEHASGAAASSNKASTPSDESLETTMTNEQLILFINSNIDQKVDGKVDQKVEEKLQPIKSKIEQNGRAFVGEVITLLLWVMGLGFGASIVALIASSLSNPSASHVLSTVSHPARAAFGLVAPIMPLVGTNCTHHAVQLNDWMQYKQVELATLRSSIEDTVNTSDANNKVFVAKQRAHDVEFQERIRAAEEATYNCIKTNNALTSEIEILKQDFDAIRRQHDVWRNQEINFLSTHMGAVVIPGKTSPTAKQGTSLLSRFVYNLLVPRRGYPSIAALMPWQEAGECWCGAGPDITLGVALSQSAYPTVFTLEHIPKQGSLDMGSKPKEIELWAHIAQSDGPVGIQGCTSQSPGAGWCCVLKKEVAPASGAATFESWYVEGAEKAVVDRVVVAVTANYGNPDATCLYRVKLAGEPVLGGK